MKSILKTVPKDLEIKYDEKFGSEINNEIMRDLISRFVKSSNIELGDVYEGPATIPSPGYRSPCISLMI